MFKFILGFFIGANLSLFLYACIYIGKQSDKNIEEMENFNERRKSD